MAARAWPPRPDYNNDVDRPDEWQDRALCAQADPDAWFPETGETTHEAKATCQRCPVIDECLDYAVAFQGELHGTWGGLGETELHGLRMAHQAAA